MGYNLSTLPFKTNGGEENPEVYKETKSKLSDKVQVAIEDWHPEIDFDEH